MTRRQGTRITFTHPPIEGRWGKRLLLCGGFVNRRKQNGSDTIAAFVRVRSQEKNKGGHACGAKCGGDPNSWEKSLLRRSGRGRRGRTTWTFY